MHEDVLVLQAAYVPSSDTMAPDLKPRPVLSRPTRQPLLTALASSVPKESAGLVGGLRVLGANTGGAAHGVFTDTVGVLSQDFFRNLLDLGVQWSASQVTDGVYEARDAGGNVVRTATAVDLVFGSNAILRGIAEVYSFEESKDKFVADFVDAWHKVMMLDRYDVG